ncbi:MAG: hypothetical protein ABIO34_04610 [Arthrobacter oryzae]
MTLNATHVKILLAVIALCGAGMLAAFSVDESLLVRDQLGGLSTVLAVGLAVGGVMVPLLGLLGSMADPRRLGSVIFMVVPMLTLAVFLDDLFDVFPVRILCVTGQVLAFIGAIAILSSASAAKKQPQP